MQTPPTFFKRLSLAMVALLMGLLMLGPFLHSHLGASVVSGFHMDGLRTAPAEVQGVAGDQTPWHHLDVTNDESPAWGVGTTRPTPEQRKQDPKQTLGECVALAAGLGLALVNVRWVLLRAHIGTLPPSRGRVRRSAAGWPPPAMAPPL